MDQEGQWRMLAEAVRQKMKVDQEGRTREGRKEMRRKRAEKKVMQGGRRLLKERERERETERERERERERGRGRQKDRVKD